MDQIAKDKKFLLNYEVLRARLDIRDFFLKHTVREVYENIGQVLSVVRMQLAVLDADNKETAIKMPTPDHLVGQTIRDLRMMCSNFYPDSDIIKDEGFVAGFNSIIRILYPDTHVKVQIRGFRKDIQSHLILIIFKLIQEILMIIGESQAELIKFSISYTKNYVKWTVDYVGKEIQLMHESLEDVRDKPLTLHERAELIGGRITVTTTKTATYRIILISPYKTFFV
jgi:signal transduction histidine kinase